MLGFEGLEGRELLAVSLAGLQTVGVWDMAIVDEVISRTEGRFTVAADLAQAGGAYSVDWGDGTTSTGTLSLADADVPATAEVTHTFQKGSFTVTVAAGVDSTSYSYSSDAMAMGNLGTPAGVESLFLVGDSRANRVSINFSAIDTLQVYLNSPLTRRYVSSAIAGIYGSLLGGNDYVTIQSSVTAATYFDLGIGNDNFTGGGGADVVIAGSGNDRVLGNNGADVIQGGDGNDWLTGGSGDDVIDAGRGNDRASGGYGDDSIFGNEGRDILFGDAGNDLLEGNDGNDNLYGGAGNDLLYGSRDNDFLDGSSGDDWLFGEQGRDYLSGGAGNDGLIGGTEVDSIFGGTGNDILAGGYDFLLNLYRRDALAVITEGWAVWWLVPPELTDPNLQPWNDNAVDVVTDKSGKNLFFQDPGDRVIGRFAPGGTDEKVVTTTPTAIDVGTIAYTTTSGIVNPTASAAQTTVILGKFTDDMDTILNTNLLCRKTMDFGRRVRGFQVLNVPDQLYLTADQFWNDYNKPFLDKAFARGDVILAATAPVSTGGYGREVTYLEETLGYTYDATLRQFVRP